ncbi:MAG: PKD domain-containing protein [Saprospiraceae bacterium]|nr:PKD domain-containing protein [Saprospiraceae bacterium]
MMKISILYFLLFLSVNTLAQSSPCFEILNLPDTIHVCKNTQIQFNPTLDNVGTIIPLDTTWSPSTGLDNPDIINPTASLGTISQQYNLVVEGLTDLNLIENWDFSLGTTGFITSYIEGFGSSGLVPEGTFAVVSNPSLVHPNFASFYDHTYGNSAGSMMVVNGSGTANTIVWLQDIIVKPDTWYDFSAWAATCVSQSPALLQFSINSVLLDTPFQLPNTTGNWVNFHSKWYSGSNVNAEISIVDQQTILGGNDFAIDDLRFREICKATDSVFVHVIDLQPEFHYDSIPGCTSDQINFTFVNEGGDFPEEFIWDFGDGTTSNELNPVHIFSPKGLYEVTMTIRKGDCIETYSLEINTADFIKQVDAFISQDKNVACINESISFYSLGQGNYPLEFFWDFGDGNTSEDFEIVHTYENPGYYTVTHIVTDNYACSDTTQVDIEVISPPQIIPVPDQKLCFGESTVVDLTHIDDIIVWYDGSKTKIRTFSISGKYSYTIINGINCYSIDTFEVKINKEPQKNNFEGKICEGASYDFFGDIYDKPGTYADTLRSFQGCDSIYYVLNLTFTPPVSATIGTDKNQICIGESIDFESHASGSYPFTYLWEFGDGSISNEQNPEYTYKKPGKFIVKHIIADKYLCSDSLFTSIEVMSYPVIVPIPDYFLCFPEKADIIISPGNATIQWNDGNADSLRILPTSGTFSYTLINEFNCSVSDTFSVFISAPASHQIIEKVLCKYEKFIFLNKTYEIPGVYFDTVFTKLDCDSIAYTIKISRFISASAASDKKFICLGDTVNFYSNDTGIDPLQFEWIFGEGDRSIIKNTSYKFKKPGKHTVIHIVTDNNSCSDTAKLEIEVYDLPKITQISDQFGCFEELIQVDVKSNNYDVIWSDGCTFKIRDISKPGTYIYTLTDAIGCKSSDTFLITKSPVPLSIKMEKTLCKYEDFSFLDKVYKNTGTYSDTIFSVKNCDSVYYDISILQYPEVPIEISGIT